MIEDEAYPTANVNLYACSICSRKFRQESLETHMKACAKLSKPKRKIFDSGKQRADGSDVIYSKTKETKKVQILGEKAEPTVSKANWREKHEQFLKSVQQARVVSEAIKTGAPLPKFEASAVPSDYVKCPFCGRNFSQNAADRHIPFCETQNKRQKINTSANQNVKSKIPTQQRKPPDSNSNEMNSYNGMHRGNNQQQHASSSNDMRGRNSNYENNSNRANTMNRYGSQTNDSKNNPSRNNSSSHNNANPNNARNSRPSVGQLVHSNSGGIERKPIRYENLYNDGDGYNDSGSYLVNSKREAAAAAAAANTQMLRTGRNMTNSELNTLARNRSGAANNAPNQRDIASNRRQYPSQENPNRAAGPKSQPQSGNNEPPGTAKFCHECGIEFPVHWARFCSFCGDKRL